jgi:hypothetical protein
MTIERITDRIQKLLKLSRSDNEHEAAQAAARAAQLMAEYEVTEAMFEMADEGHKPEAIIEGNLDDQQTRNRIAWREVITTVVARSYDCHTYFGKRANLYALGRESSVSAWRYTCSYLFNEVNRLADEAWIANEADLVAVGIVPKSWKNSFRMGAAHVIRDRLNKTIMERKETQAKHALEAAKALQLAGDTSSSSNVGTSAALVKSTQALAIVERGTTEVKAAFEKKTKGWKNTRSIGSVSNHSGYQTGRKAGATIALGGSKGSLGKGESLGKGKS